MQSLLPIQGIDIYLLDQFLKGRLNPDMSVLDAGCGHGRNILWLLQNDYMVSAFDANENAIQELKADFPQSADRFSVARLEEFTSEKQYDFVICNAVLHFAHDHPHFDAMFGNLVKLMKQGGILFIRMTSDIGLEDRIGKGKDGVFELPDGSTRYLLTRVRVDELLLQYGLRLIEPVKTVFVDGLRSMTTLVFQR
jgi:SAM-dependent methyltransferase